MAMPVRRVLPVARRAAAGRRSVLTHLDPVAVVGILLSIALSIALDLSGAASGVESLLAGLMGTTISLLIDSIARAERRFHLRALVQGPPWLPTSVTSIAEGARAAVETYPGTPVAAEARRRCELLVAEMDQVRAGRIIRPGADSQDLFAGTRAVVSRLDAVTNVLPRASGELSWWRSGTGRDYWKTNLAALARGAEINRIFLFAAMTDELRSLLDEQRDAGVRVFLLERGPATTELHVNLAIWDSAQAWESRFGADGEIRENRFTVNHADLRRLRDAFGTCLSLARRLD
ncbi:hypothetical protein [Plantactinospora sp. GCM10030261]|uniref:hypothetical protein n=1 Tax=Plantactinospora sp. GCM10030261 TaxID=3273420 RepID=UPI00360AA896